MLCFMKKYEANFILYYELLKLKITFYINYFENIKTPGL